jgi:hypothetical protein
VAGHPAALGDCKRDRLERIETGKQRVDLERARKTAPHPLLRSERGDVVAGEENLPGIGRQHAGHQVDQCGLAGAVRPDESITCADRKIDRDVPRDRQRAECLGQSARAQSDRGFRLCGRAHLPLHRA